jgi:predicted ester cyclase
MNPPVISLLQGASSALFVEGDLGAVSKYFARDYVAHITNEDMRGGHALIQSIVGLYRGAFSDLNIEVEVLVKSSDRVAWQRTMRAKHTGAFKGFPGTGQRMVWRDMVVSRIVAGLIVEEWVVTDLAERLLLARKAMPGRPSAKTSRRRRPKRA